MLWENGILGDHSPQQLVDTVLYLNGIHFALRGGLEHRGLAIGRQITGPHVDTEIGKQYLLFREEVSKTNSGGLKHRKRIPKVTRAYANNAEPERCLVRLYLKYISLW